MVDFYVTNRFDATKTKSNKVFSFRKRNVVEQRNFYRNFIENRFDRIETTVDRFDRTKRSILSTSSIDFLVNRKSERSANKIETFSNFSSRSFENQRTNRWKNVRRTQIKSLKYRIFRHLDHHNEFEQSSSFDNRRNSSNEFESITFDSFDRKIRVFSIRFSRFFFLRRSNFSPLRKQTKKFFFMTNRKVNFRPSFRTKNFRFWSTTISMNFDVVLKMFFEKNHR